MVYLKEAKPIGVLEIGCPSLVIKKLEIYLLRSSFFSKAAGWRFAALRQIEYTKGYFFKVLKHRHRITILQNNKLFN